eukprot:5017530-Pyramimonas_sp.AAC.1
MGEAGVHLVGLQESWNAKGVRRVGDFFAAASGFSDDGFGVEFWLNVVKPYAVRGDKPVTFCPDDLRILFGDPRHLV